MDQKLLFLINREWTNPVADRVMALLSSWDAWLPLVAILAVILAIRGGFRARAFLLTALVIVGLNDGLISNSLKHLVNRPRPHQMIDGVRVVDLGKAKPRVLAVFSEAKVKLSRPDLAELAQVEGRSFPSSHTINTISAALLGLCFFGARAAWGLLLALAVAYSRIYTGSHWPSDILTSIFLGLGSTLVLLAGVNALWRHFGARWLPAVHEEHPTLFAA
jgi:undecaprenyl-diphosphatase